MSLMCKSKDILANTLCIGSEVPPPSCHCRRYTACPNGRGPRSSAGSSARDASRTGAPTALWCPSIAGRRVL
eukprot:1542107-Pleurochrysis_carterae.AAC.1